MKFPFFINLHKARQIFFIFLAIFFLATAFGLGFAAGKQQHTIETISVANVTNKELPAFLQNLPSGGVDFALFWNVWSRLQEKFIDKEKIEPQKMVYGAISGMVNSLGDPYTVFMPPQQSKSFKEEIKGSFGGIGAEIGIKKNMLTIIAPIKDSPAEKIGLKAKDQILKINATSTQDLRLEEAISFIRGPIGTQVTLTIFRDSFNAPKEFAITRAEIKIPTIKHESKGNGIYYMALYNFNEVSGSQFRDALQGFFNSGSKKLILDLRNNPGGYLEMAVDIASFFTPAGATIVRESFYTGEEQLYRSVGYNLLKNTPVVLLVNGGSASASEILAGALRDHNGSLLIGEKTYGKGSVQELVNLPNEASLKVTIARWLTPNGAEINGNGLEADIKVEIPEKPEEDKDYYLEKAMEVIKNESGIAKKAGKKQ